MARSGLAGLGKAGLGLAWEPMAHYKIRGVRCGSAGRGWVWRGRAREPMAHLQHLKQGPGGARHGKARYGMAGQGKGANGS